MTQTPIRCKSDRLLALQCIPYNVWCQECQIDHLLNATLGCLFCIRDLVKALARFHLLEPTVRLGNVADQDVVLSNWHIREDQLSLNSAFSDLEHAADLEFYLIQSVGISIQNVRYLVWVDLNCDLARCNRDLHRETKEIRTRPKVSEWGVFCHPAKLRN